MKRKSVSALKKELDKWFSLYIRHKYVRNGTVYCYTCNKPMLIKEAHCGHFVPRNYLATRFDEDNLRVQCPGCNLFGNGKPLDFEENLKAELGETAVEELKQKRHKITILSPSWYSEQIALYKDLVNNLIAKEGEVVY